MKYTFLVLCILICIGCQTDIDSEKVGHPIDTDFMTLKSEYMKAEGVQVDSELVDQLLNMVAVAEKTNDLQWSLAKLFKLLESQGEYTTIIEISDQVSHRSINSSLREFLAHQKANAYHKLSMNQWAKWMGASHYYRNYDYLRQAKSAYQALIRDYPKRSDIKILKQVLSEIKTELARYEAEVSELNATKRLSHYL